MIINFHSDVRFSGIIYRDARNGIPKPWANSNDSNFLLGCLIESNKYIVMLEIECWSSEQIQTTITFHSVVWLSPVIYRVAWNWLSKLWANSDDNNFLLGCVWLSPVIYRVAQNGIPKICANSNDNNFLLGCLIESRNISTCSKWNTEALSKFKRQ